MLERVYPNEMLPCGTLSRQLFSFLVLEARLQFVLQHTVLACLDLKYHLNPNDLMHDLQALNLDCSFWKHLSQNLSRDLTFYQT